MANNGIRQCLNCRNEIGRENLMKKILNMYEKIILSIAVQKHNINVQLDFVSCDAIFNLGFGRCVSEEPACVAYTTDASTYSYLFLKKFKLIFLITGHNDTSRKKKAKSHQIPSPYLNLSHCPKPKRRYTITLNEKNVSSIGDNIGLLPRSGMADEDKEHR